MSMGTGTRFLCGDAARMRIRLMRIRNRILGCGFGTESLDADSEPNPWMRILLHHLSAV